MADYWNGMEHDPESCERIRKSIELLDAKDGMTVLDVGCYKQVARRYLSPNVKYAGIDITDYTPLVNIKDIDGGFAWPEKVDRIICLEVLEHLKYPEGTLKSIHRALKDDGVAVISLPNEANLLARMRSLFGVQDVECFSEKGKHLHLPSLRQCRRFLKQYFVIAREVYYVSSCGSRSKTISRLLQIMPKWLQSSLAYFYPCLFARGFIFRLRKLHG